MGFKPRGRRGTRRSFFFIHRHPNLLQPIRPKKISSGCIYLLPNSKILSRKHIDIGKLLVYCFAVVSYALQRIFGMSVGFKEILLFLRSK